MQSVRHTQTESATFLCMPQQLYMWRGSEAARRNHDSRATVQCTPLNAMASIHAPSASENDRRGLPIEGKDQRDQSEAHCAVTQRLDSPCTVDRRVTEAMRFGTASNTMMAIFRVEHDL